MSAPEVIQIILRFAAILGELIAKGITAPEVLQRLQRIAPKAANIDADIDRIVRGKVSGDDDDRD